MKSAFICCLLFFLCGYLFAQTKEDKLEQLKRRTDIKVTEIHKDLLKLEYQNGKVRYKFISDYSSTVTGKLNYSPAFDSTIIDITVLDTSLYYYKYSFWQEVPLSNLDFDYLRISDINKNNKPELYGPRRFFTTPLPVDQVEPVTVYEANESGIFNFIFQYDTVVHIQNIYDVDKDGEPEVHFTPSAYLPYEQRYYSKPYETSLATELNTTFYYEAQLDDQTLGDFDGDQFTDLVFDSHSPPFVLIYEYNPLINYFDSVFRFQVPDPIDLGIGGYSVGDFDLDGKTDIVFSTVRGKVFVIENESDNLYNIVWQGSVESNNAYIHAWTKDLDKNGKPEFWVLADAYYNGIGTTRITIFETDGDNSYQAVGKIDLVGVMSFYAGNVQPVDIDGDGTEEIAICIDDNFLILKFNGSRDHHSYEVYYIKQNEPGTEDDYQVYFGATMYDLQNNGEYEILISIAHTIKLPYIMGRYITKIYRPDSLSSVISDNSIVPSSPYLYQNYPNPFNPSTKIEFGINQQSNTTIKVFNILGKEITTLLNKELTPGNYTINWEAKDSNGNLLPSGVYIIILSADSQSGNFTQPIKALLLK